MDSSGNVLGNVSTQPSPYAIIPSYTVNYDVALARSLSPGTYSVKSEMTLGTDTPRFKNHNVRGENQLRCPVQGSECHPEPQNSRYWYRQTG